MAHIVTLQILVDESEESSVYDSLNELLRSAQDTENGNIIDWKVENAYPINASLEDSLFNETYSEGEAFSDWVIYSVSEAESSEDNAGFWSNELGWTVLKSATRFGGMHITMPKAREDDACLFLLSQFNK